MADGEEEVCAICISVVVIGQHKSDKTERPGVKLDCCTHLYHLECITPWFDGHNTCPQCKRTVNSFFNYCEGTSVLVHVPNRHENETYQRELPEETREPCHSCRRLEHKESMFPLENNLVCYRCRPAATYPLPEQFTQRSPCVLPSVHPELSDVERAAVESTMVDSKEGAQGRVSLSESKQLVSEMSEALVLDLLHDKVNNRSTMLIRIVEHCSRLTKTGQLRNFLVQTTFLDQVASWIFPDKLAEKDQHVRYTLLNLVLRILPHLSKSLLKRSKLGISVMKCWIAKAEETDKNRRLALRIVEAMAHNVYSSSVTPKRMTPSKKRQRPASLALEKTQVQKCSPIHGDSTLKDVVPNKVKVDSILSSYMSTGVPASDVPQQKTTAVKVPVLTTKSNKSRIISETKEVIANHVKRYLRRSKLSREQFKSIARASTNQYMQDIKGEVDIAIEKCDRVKVYGKYFQASDLVTVEAVHRVVRRNLVSLSSRVGRPK